MDIKTFVQVISKLPPQIAVLAKGPTGIGKSHIVHQVGDRLDMEVIDRRLSQMTEGDIIGLPEPVDGVTRSRLFLIESLTVISFIQIPEFMQQLMKEVNTK